MFSYCHKVWSLQSPKTSPKQSDFPEICIKPNITSVCIPISCSLQLDSVFNHWPYLNHKRIIYALLVRCLLYFIEFFYLFPYCVLILCARCQEGGIDRLLTDPFECFQKIQRFLFLLLPHWAVFLHHYGFYTDNYYLQTEVNYLLSLTEKIWTFHNVFQNYFSISNTCNQTEAKAESITCGTSNFTQKNATLVILDFKWDGLLQSWLPEVKEKILNIKIL